MTSQTSIAIVKVNCQHHEDLHGYCLFTHISAALGGFMFAKRANHGVMRKSY